MAKMAVITDPALASGFRLAGVEVHAVGSAEEARRLLLTLMDEAESGVIAINADYLSALDDMTRRRLEESYRPVVVALPTGVALAPMERRSSRIAELIRRAIGIRITFREG